jgi:hypothetical protein
MLCEGAADGGGALGMGDAAQELLAEPLDVDIRSARAGDSSVWRYVRATSCTL